MAPKSTYRGPRAMSILPSRDVRERCLCPGQVWRSGIVFTCSRLALGWRRHPLVKGPVARVSWQPLPALQGTGRGEMLPRHYFSRAVPSPEAAICAHELPDLPFFAFLMGEHVRVFGLKRPTGFGRDLRRKFRARDQSIWRVFLSSRACSSSRRAISATADSAPPSRVVLLHRHHLDRPRRPRRQRTPCAEISK